MPLPGGSPPGPIVVTLGMKSVAVNISAIETLCCLLPSRLSPQPQLALLQADILIVSPSCRPQGLPHQDPLPLPRPWMAGSSLLPGLTRQAASSGVPDHWSDNPTCLFLIRIILLQCGPLCDVACSARCPRAPAASVGAQRTVSTQLEAPGGRRGPVPKQPSALHPYLASLLC